MDKKSMMDVKMRKYTVRCIHFCWYAAIQDPPLYIQFEEDSCEATVFDGARYKDYTKRGQYVAFVVWPALYLFQNGALLAKGVAQGTNEKPTKKANQDISLLPEAETRGHDIAGDVHMKHKEILERKTVITIGSTQQDTKHEIQNKSCESNSNDDHELRSSKEMPQKGYEGDQPRNILSEGDLNGAKCNLTKTGSLHKSDGGPKEIGKFGFWYR